MAFWGTAELREWEGRREKTCCAVERGAGQVVRGAQGGARWAECPLWGADSLGGAIVSVEGQGARKGALCSHSNGGVWASWGAAGHFPGGLGAPPGRFPGPEPPS